MSRRPADEVAAPQRLERKPASPRWFGFLMAIAVLGLVAATRSCRPDPELVTNPELTPAGAPIPSDL